MEIENFEFPEERNKNSIRIQNEKLIKQVQQTPKQNALQIAININIMRLLVVSTVGRLHFVSHSFFEVFNFCFVLFFTAVSWKQCSPDLEMFG